MESLVNSPAGSAFCAIGEESNVAHLPRTQRAFRQKDFVVSGDAADFTRITAARFDLTRYHLKHPIDHPHMKMHRGSGWRGIATCAAQVND